MLKYKLTTQNLTTYNGFQWEVGKKVTTSGRNELCSDGWLHYYHHPFLAVIMNPRHANITNPKLWKVEAEGIHKNDLGRKGGCTEMTLLEEIPMVNPTLNQRIAFAILCAKKVYSDKKWNEWADKWLRNENRTKKSAAADAAYAAADAAAAYAAAAYAAAASAGYTAAYAAAYAAAAYATDSAAYAAAVYATNAKKSLNLIAIAEIAITF